MRLRNATWGDHPIGYGWTVVQEVGDCTMSATEIYSCLRDLQVVATVPHISEEQITELVKKKLIVRAAKSDGILLTQLGVHTKTGHA